MYSTPQARINLNISEKTLVEQTLLYKYNNLEKDYKFKKNLERVQQNYYFVLNGLKHKKDIYIDQRERQLRLHGKFNTFVFFFNPSIVFLFIQRSKLWG